ncbi:Forkhead box protein O [Colletotrichum plurivorum]|uniref:Forkhead box protein O n=1 Tax=Colletotrichum plurivorum TaxID=2175906 RepID=A0A8H6JD91_9PEZI|nr:Forkhead box protein O [Colletotrichum plurivorum]
MAASISYIESDAVRNCHMDLIQLPPDVFEHCYNPYLSPGCATSWASTTTSLNSAYYPQQIFDGLTSEYMVMGQYDTRGANVHISPDYVNHNSTQDLEGYLEGDDIKHKTTGAANTLASPYSVPSASIPEDFRPGPEVISTGGPASLPTHVAGTAITNAKADGKETYSTLIWKALKSQDSRSMTVRQIYRWFMDNTDKPKMTKNKTWQSSIRYNLTMNPAFKLKGKGGECRGDAPKGKKQKLSAWCLDEGFEDGVGRSWTT